jgi:hypothetical protein
MMNETKHALENVPDDVLQDAFHGAMSLRGDYVPNCREFREHNKRVKYYLAEMQRRVHPNG